MKHFDAWQHLVIMLYAVIKRFDSLREITDSMFPEARKFSHLGISMMPRRSTLSDANARRPEGIFEAAYRDLYATYKDELSSDSPLNQITLAQAIETELPAEILLWGECQCHQEMQTSRVNFLLVFRRSWSFFDFLANNGKDHEGVITTNTTLTTPSTQAEGCHQSWEYRLPSG